MQMATGQTSSERRANPRRRALKQAKLILSDWTCIDCLVRDIAERGVRIVLPGPTELPKTFRVLLVSSDEMVPASLEWQRGLAAGIRFTGPSQPAPAVCK